MDFSIYIESIIDKMQSAGFYSEIEEDDLRHQIELYLKREYNKRVELAAFEYDLSQASGKPQSVEEVKSTLAGIKSEIISIIRDLSKTKL